MKLRSLERPSVSDPIITHFSLSLSLFGTGVVNEGSINCLGSNASGLGLGHATRLLLGKKTY
jgi:hypothetical protein